MNKSSFGSTWPFNKRGLDLLYNAYIPSLFFYLFFVAFIYVVKSSQSTAKIEELLQEDGNVKRKREKVQKQSSLLSKLTRQLSIHDNRAAAAAGISNDSPAGNNSVKLRSSLFMKGRSDKTVGQVTSQHGNFTGWVGMKHLLSKLLRFI